MRVSKEKKPVALKNAKIIGLASLAEERQTRTPQVVKAVAEAAASARKLSFAGLAHKKSSSHSVLSKTKSFAEVRVDRKISEAKEGFEVRSEKVLSKEDSRTTLMIKNIPNKYTLTAFKEEIDTVLVKKYDMLYMPLDNNVWF